MHLFGCDKQKEYNSSGDGVGGKSTARSMTNIAGNI